MKRILILLTAVFLMSLSGAFAQEDAYYEEVTDVLEVGITGGLGVPFGSITDFTDTTKSFNVFSTNTGWNVGLEVGYFLKPSIVLGFDFTFHQFTIENQNDPEILGAVGVPNLTYLEVEPNAGILKHRLYSPTVYLKYYFFGESNFAPFLRASAGLGFPKFTTIITRNTTEPRYRQLSYDPVLELGVGGGVFYYTSDWSGIYLDVRYTHVFSKDVTTQYSGTDFIFGEDMNLFDVKFGINVFFGSGE